MINSPYTRLQIAKDIGELGLAIADLVYKLEQKVLLKVTLL